MDWTPEMDARLIAGLGGKGADRRALAASLGVTYSALKNRVSKLGCGTGPRGGWSGAELAVVREHYRKLSAAAIAALLPGRTESNVHALARRIGLCSASHRFTPQEDAELIRLLGLGHNDREAAGLMGMDRSAVTDRRRLLGLPGNGDTARTLAAKAANARRTLAAHGFRYPAELRHRRWREHACSRNWPEELSPRAVQVIECLCDEGPATKEQMRARLNLPPHFNFHANGRGGKNCLFRWLDVIGLSHTVKGAACGRDGRMNVCVHFPSADALARREGFLRKAANGG